MGEFIKLKKASKSVKEYSLKFTIFYKYSPRLVDSPRNLMNRFMIGVSELVKEEWRTTMLINETYISLLMVFSTKLKC